MHRLTFQLTSLRYSYRDEIRNAIFRALFITLLDLFFMSTIINHEHIVWSACGVITLHSSYMKMQSFSASQTRVIFHIQYYSSNSVGLLPTRNSFVNCSLHLFDETFLSFADPIWSCLPALSQKYRRKLSSYKRVSEQ